MALDAIPATGARTRRRRGLRQPRLRTRGDRPRRRGRDGLRAAGRAFLTFKDQVIFERDEVADGQPASRSPCSRPTSTPGCAQLDDFQLRRIRWRSISARSRRRRIRTRSCRRSRRSDSAHTNLHDLRIPTGDERRARAVRRFSRPHRRLRAGARLSGAQGAFATCRCTCASARSRSATLARAAHARMQAGSDGRDDLALGADLAGLLSPDPAPSSARDRPAPSGANTTASRGTRPPTAVRAWCEGRTGYPLVDAAMPQINQTGYMHNRLRMVVGELSDQGPRHRLAARRALFRART